MVEENVDLLIEFSNLIPSDLIPSIFDEAFKGLTEDQVVYIQNLLDSNPKVSMAVAYSFTPVNDIGLRDTLLSYMIPNVFDGNLKDYFNKINEYQNLLIKLGDSIKDEPIPYSDLINQWSDRFNQVAWADRLYKQPHIPEISSMSIADLRNFVMQKNTIHKEGGTIIHETICRCPGYKPITRRFIESPEEERLESIIELSNKTEMKQWEYNAINWLTENYQVFINHPNIRNKLLMDTGWKGKPFSHWVIIKFDGKEIKRFSMSLVGKLQNLVEKHFNTILEMAFKKHGDIHILAPEIIKKMKNPELLNEIWENENIKEKSEDDKTISKQKNWIIALVLHKLALEYSKDIKKIAGWYSNKIYYQALQANQPEIRAIKLNKDKIIKEPLDQKNTLRLDHPKKEGGTGKTTDPYNLISFSSDSEEKIILKNSIDLIFSDLRDKDEQIILKALLDEEPQNKTAEKMGISESFLTKKKIAMFTKLKKKYKKETLF